jgi:hypothetical protein
MAAGAAQASNGVAFAMVKVKVCVVSDPTPLCAVIVNVYMPPLPGAGVPLSVAVPFPLSVNVTPGGRVPVSDSAGVGFPVVVMLNEPGRPNVKLAALVLVIAAA